MHILLLEPDALQARAYMAALERAGHTALHTTGAQAAVLLADQRTPDAVVLELLLPGHNGVEFLYEFRSYPEWLHIPVLLHTFVPPQDLDFAATLQRELGVRRVLYKPATTLAALCDAVQQMALPKSA